MAKTIFEEMGGTYVRQHISFIITQKKIFFNIRRKDLHLFQFCSIIKEIVIYPMKQGEKLWYY